MPAAYRHFGCRLMDDLHYKVQRALFLENESLRVGVLLDKGADLFQLLHKPSDTDFLWRSPLGLLRPERAHVSTASSTGVFLDTYHGGWQEILPGGGPAVYQGAEIGLHGEVTQLGWEMHILEDNPQRVSVRLSVECIRTPLRLERTLSLVSGTATLFIQETLTNLSPSPFELMWGQHPAFGAPFLREGLRLFVPAGRVVMHEPQFLANSRFQPGAEFDWPAALDLNQQPVDLSWLPGPQAGSGELMYLTDLSGGWFALLDTERELGIGLAWPKEIYPYLWFWQVNGLAAGYPWWDRVYVTALEPWSSMPNSLDKAIAAKTTLSLKGGEQIELEMSVPVITGRKRVQSINLYGEIQ